MNGIFHGGMDAANKCPDLPTNPDVVVKYTNGQNFPSTALVSCPTGYALQPADATSLECAFTAGPSPVGTWTGTNPTCTRESSLRSTR